MKRVLCVLWVDQAPVRLLSTRHFVFDYVESERRRPRLTSANAASVRAVFGEVSIKILRITTVIDYYNCNKVGVDLNDQLRSYYCPNLRSSRNWFAMLVFLLGCAIINSRILAKNLGNIDFSTETSRKLGERNDFSRYQPQKKKKKKEEKGEEREVEV